MDCVWCEQPVYTGSVIQTVGANVMHPKCYTSYGNELEKTSMTTNEKLDDSRKFFDTLYSNYTPNEHIALMQNMLNDARQRVTTQTGSSNIDSLSHEDMFSRLCELQQYVVALQCHVDHLLDKVPSNLSLCCWCYRAANGAPVHYAGMDHPACAEHSALHG